MAQNDSQTGSAPSQSDVQVIAKARLAAQALLQQCASLMLASITAEGMPLASYTPFVREADGSLIIAVSGLAAHGQSLARQAQVSVLIIEDEAAARQIYARQRINLLCRVEVLSGSDRAAAFATLAQRFGEMAQLLAGLGDFSAYRLVPEQGRFVMGFGVAYHMDHGDPHQLRAVMPRTR